MYWVSEIIERFKEVPDTYVILSMASRLFLGAGLGVLFAPQLTIWTGWIFIFVAVALAIPSIVKVYLR
ncbi:hypothetical protein ACFLVJ_01495 [Chloroflexota bacterium]